MTDLLTGYAAPAQALPTPAGPRRVPFTRTHICDAARENAGRVLASGWVTSGPEVAAFEEEFAPVVGARHAVAVASCTAAIELALRGLRLPPESPVLVSTNTFCGAVGAIVHAGLRPHLVDIDEVTGMPSPETTAAAAQGLRGPRGLLVVHLAGYPADVAELAAAAGVGLENVVEDAAHALGTWVGDRPVGSISRATCFSFYATKNLAIGEGGMVTTDDDDLATYLASARLHGMSRDAWKRYLPGGGWRYDVEVDGMKANLTDLQAAIGRAQLAEFDRVQSHRHSVAEWYDAGLAGADRFTLPARPTTGRHAWHLYAIRVRPGAGPGRDALIGALAERGIGTSVHFIPVHHLTWYRSRCVAPLGGLRHADTVFDQTLSLPLDAVVSRADVDAVTSALLDLGGPS